MTRMGHSSSRAALIYQHMTSDRDRAIADRLCAMIRGGAGAASGSSEKDPTGPQWHACATTLKRLRASLGGNPPELAVSSVPPAGFEPTTPALGERRGAWAVTYGFAGRAGQPR